MHASSVLLLGVELPDAPMVADTLLAAQGPSGGWSDQSDGRATLGASYRVSRVLRALSSPPNAETANRFLRACRRSDGSYAGSTDDQAGDLANTYLALTIDRWINEPDRGGMN